MTNIPKYLNDLIKLIDYIPDKDNRKILCINLVQKIFEEFMLNKTKNLKKIKKYCLEIDIFDKDKKHAYFDQQYYLRKYKSKCSPDFMMIVYCTDIIIHVKNNPTGWVIPPKIDNPQKYMSIIFDSYRKFHRNVHGFFEREYDRQELLKIFKQESLWFGYNSQASYHRSLRHHIEKKNITEMYINSNEKFQFTSINGSNTNQNNQDEDVNNDDQTQNTTINYNDYSKDCYDLNNDYHKKQFEKVKKNIPKWLNNNTTTIISKFVKKIKTFGPEKEYTKQELINIANSCGDQNANSNFLTDITKIRNNNYGKILSKHNTENKYTVCEILLPILYQ